MLPQGRSVRCEQQREALPWFFDGKLAVGRLEVVGPNAGLMGPLLKPCCHAHVCPDVVVMWYIGGSDGTVVYASAEVFASAYLVGLDHGETDRGWAG